MQGFQAVGDADGVLGTAVGGELGFEGLGFLAEDEPAGVEHAVECLVELLALAEVDGPQVEEGDHGCLPSEVGLREPAPNSSSHALTAASG